MAATASAPTVFQGIEVPTESVNPGQFQALTRRQRNADYSGSFSGLGTTQSVPLRKADIISQIRVRFSGEVTTSGTTAVTPTYRWPYDLVTLRFTANGKSNLCNATGLKYKAREFMKASQRITDRGVSQKIGSATVTQGTLSKASESWGVYPGVAATTGAGTYPVELEWIIPVAEDPRDLAGAIFAQTSTMDLVVNIDWAQPGDLFSFASSTAGVTVTGNVIVEVERYTIPTLSGKMVLPDLSLFHGFIQSRVSNSLSIGENEVRLIGQGSGQQLLRSFYQVWNGSAPQVPLAANATNYGMQAWRYGSNLTPESYDDGQSMREDNEEVYGSDIGAVWGFLSWEFNVVNAFRDTVDMGQTSELRLVSTINSGVTLASPAFEYVQETMFGAGA